MSDNLVLMPLGREVIWKRFRDRLPIKGEDDHNGMIILYDEITEDICCVGVGSADAYQNLWSHWANPYLVVRKPSDIDKQ